MVQLFGNQNYMCLPDQYMDCHMGDQQAPLLISTQMWSSCSVQDEPLDLSTKGVSQQYQDEPLDLSVAVSDFTAPHDSDFTAPHDDKLQTSPLHRDIEILSTLHIENSTPQLSYFDEDFHTGQKMHDTQDLSIQYSDRSTPQQLDDEEQLEHLPHHHIDSGALSIQHPDKFTPQHLDDDKELETLKHHHIEIQHPDSSSPQKFYVNEEELHNCSEGLSTPQSEISNPKQWNHYEQRDQKNKYNNPPMKRLILKLPKIALSNVTNFTLKLNNQSTDVEKKSPKAKRKKRKKKVLQEDSKDANYEFFKQIRAGRVGKRQPTSEKMELYQQSLQEKVLSGCEDGLKVVQTEAKGRGVVADKVFAREDFVVEYAGELITNAQARQRELQFEQDGNMACYMYYFQHGNKRYCVDATMDSGRLGRLLNHSRRSFNCHMKVMTIGLAPRLVLVASRTIQIGEELLYDYGDRRPSSLLNHPWLKE